ncbi:hypothetical protein HKBW3S03_01873 [Candidatus Hakubella thermalkaliphila]|uniref:Uncharacterized protein n=2 Tax=Candidatus Hakubella thermalkaliphila TaxID=2754717 RepID=A0A6V8NLZ6_9ACTN|nr:hypothetical protein HKBW3S03_01873 [Candidatus Hakubella thermalkaliphila]
MKLGTQKVIVLAAWALTSLFSPLLWLGVPSFSRELMSFFDLNAVIDSAYWWWLSTLLVATATALALGLKNAFLALPGLLWPPFLVLSIVFAGKFSDFRPMYLDLLFFLFFATRLHALRFIMNSLAASPLPAKRKELSEPKSRHTLITIHSQTN